MTNALTARIARAALQSGVLAVVATLALAGANYPALAILVIAAVIYNYSRRPPPVTTSYGSARWANYQDMQAAGLLHQAHGLPLGDASIGNPPIAAAIAGLFVDQDAELACKQFFAALGYSGSFAGQQLRWDDDQAAVIFAPPGRGKTTGFIIPALSDPSPAIVLDPKGEVVKATGLLRANCFGHKLIIFDPYNVLGMGDHRHHYNPLDGIDPASPKACKELLSIADALVTRTGTEGDGAYFLDQATLVLFAAMAFSLTHGSPRQRNLVDVQGLLADPDARIAAVATMAKSPAWAGILSSLGGQLSQLRDREEASVYASALKQLNFLYSQELRSFLKESDCDPGKALLQGNRTVYLVMPPDKMQGPQAPFLRLILAGILGRIFREGASNQRCIRVFLDEAAALGKMTCIDQALAVGRGYGIRMVFAYQSMGQLLASYPQGQHQTFLSNVGCQIFLGAPNDYQTAEYISNLLGDGTIPITTTSTGTSTGTSSSASSSAQSEQQQYGTNRGTNRGENRSEIARKLMQPAEILRISARFAIVVLPGKCRPMLTVMRRWFEGGTAVASSGNAKLLWQSFGFLAFAVLVLIGWIAFVNDRPKPRPAPTRWQPVPAELEPEPPRKPTHPTQRPRPGSSR